jgi:hypothetical protein
LLDDDRVVLCVTRVTGRADVSTRPWVILKKRVKSRYSCQYDTESEVPRPKSTCDVIIERVYYRNNCAIQSRDPVITCNVLHVVTDCFDLH